MCVSCDYPLCHKSLQLEVRSSSQDIYWQMLKDGEPDTGEYKPFPTHAAWFYDIEPGDNYTLRFYKVDSTFIEEIGGQLIEKRIITDTYETHLTIDHYMNIVTVTYTKDEGLGCKIEQSYLIN